MRRRVAGIISVVVAVATVGIGATAVIAGVQHHAGVRTHGVDTQTLMWWSGMNNRVYTASDKWEVLQLPSGGCRVGQTTCGASSFDSPSVFAKGPISVTFSGMFSRAPVELRFRDGDHLMRPGAVDFRPQQGSNAFSFTFVSPRKGERLCEGPVLEWRSPTGREVRLNKATIVVNYTRFTPSQRVGCL